MSKKVFNLIILGSAGSGKGTQAKLLAEKYNLQILETGELIRHAAKEKTERGRLTKWIHKVGMHFPDDFVFDLVAPVFKRRAKKQGVLFDGYPRTAGQAWDLDRLTKAYTRNRRTFALWIDVGGKDALQRLLTRSVCTKCGKIFTSRKIKKCLKCGAKVEVRDYDMDKKAILKRIDWFNTRVMPAIEFYQQRKMLIKVNGEQSIENVFKETVKKLDQKIR